MAGLTSLTVPIVVSRYAEPAVTYSRFGVGAPRPYEVTEYPVASLGAGWYWDWAARPDAPRPEGVEYYPTVRLSQVGETGFSFHPDAATIAATAEAHPGAVWLIGNEPDRKFWQDDLLPEVYAGAYAHLYDLIKEIDPTALIAAGQIVQPTPLRLEYLNRVLDAYRAARGTEMPVDVWAIHAYPLNEDAAGWGADVPPGFEETQGFLIDIEDTKDPAIFRQFILDFRQWMADNGYRDCPLLVTEFGVLMPKDYAGFQEPDVIAYMEATFDYLVETSGETGYPADDNRLVQRWAWYSLTGRAGEDGDVGALAGWLYNADTRSRTGVGQALRGYVSSLPHTVNLRPARLTAQPVEPAVPGEPVDVLLTAAVLNNGSVTAGGPVRVRLYDGDPDLGGAQIGTEQVIERLAGGAVPRLVQVNWEDAPSGVWDVVVVVDPANVVAETDEQDNRLLGRVSVPAS